MQWGLTSVVPDPGLPRCPRVPGVVPVPGGQPRAAPHQHDGEHPPSLSAEGAASQHLHLSHTRLALSKDSQAPRRPRPI
ncbi:hypothetical protein NPIL_437291 [Nephila pilipes]|uniref:Uncharacterized protein n=1 Tax=Nephila pilipes TaxID=299642 RepID=A0A8X6Q6X1_NEPPI|nr:hypothetical protein NPIL_437291 [Nephila pilipes]